MARRKAGRFEGGTKPADAALAPRTALGRRWTGIGWVSMSACWARACASSRRRRRPRGAVARTYAVHAASATKATVRPSRGGSSGIAMPTKPPSTHASWQVVSLRPNALACTCVGMSRWMVASRENLAIACASPADQPEQRERPDAVEQRGQQRRRPRRRPARAPRPSPGVIRCSVEAARVPSDAAEAGGADHDADHHAGAERAVRPHVGVAQQERHEHQQEAAEEPRARSWRAARTRPGRGSACAAGRAARCCPPGRARTARPRPRWSRPPAGSRIAQTVAMTNSSERVAQRPLRARPATPARRSAPRREAPTMPASETRPLALTRVKSRGSRRGTAAARVTPYALDETSTPSAAAKTSAEPLVDRRGQHPAEEGAHRHRRADRPAPAVREPVEERADQRRHDRERQHRQAEEQRDLVARLARRHLEEQAAGQRDRHRGVAGGVEDVHLDQPVQAGLAGALGLRGAAGLDHGEPAGPRRAAPQRAQPAAGRLRPAGEAAPDLAGPVGSRDRRRGDRHPCGCSSLQRCGSSATHPSCPTARPNLTQPPPMGDTCAREHPRHHRRAARPSRRRAGLGRRRRPRRAARGRRRRRRRRPPRRGQRGGAGGHPPVRLHPQGVRRLALVGHRHPRLAAQGASPSTRSC